MSLEKSKWARPPRKKNQWREIEISEDILRDAITIALLTYKKILRTEEIERVIVGEPSKTGVYSLSVAVSKKGG